MAREQNGGLPDIGALAEVEASAKRLQERRDITYSCEAGLPNKHGRDGDMYIQIRNGSNILHAFSTGLKLEMVMGIVRLLQNG